MEGGGRLFPAKKFKRGTLIQVGIDLALRGSVGLQQATMGVGGEMLEVMTL